jgi:hypothetical protein
MHVRTSVWFLPPFPTHVHSGTLFVALKFDSIILGDISGARTLHTERATTP